MRESTAKLIAEYEARIALMKQEDGKTKFECKLFGDRDWVLACDGFYPGWLFHTSEYRVKSKLEEAWAWKYPNGDFGECLYKEKLEPSMVETGRVMVLMREVTND